MIYLFPSLSILFFFLFIFILIRNRITSSQLEGIKQNLSDKENLIQKQEMEVKILLENKGELKTLKEEKERVQNRLISLTEENAKIKNSLETKESILKEREAYFKELQEKFKLLSQEALDTNATKTKMNLHDILNPFKENIEKFQKRVEEINENQIKEQASLKTEIQGIVKSSEVIGNQAQNLADALKGDKKMLGNWGEVQLMRILEISGLKKGIDYIAQATILSDEEKIFRPDVIINLPDKRQIIIDAKASLVNYEKYYNSQIIEEKESYMKAMMNDIGNRIKELSSKSYQKSNTLDSIDFVIMFMPIEAAYISAINYDHQFFEDAWGKNVIIANASTLYGILKGVSHIRKLETQNKNAAHIFNEAGGLYDKFVGFINDLSQIGKSLDNAQKNYSDAFNKLKDGKGSLIKRAEKLIELGTKSSKQIPTSFNEQEESSLLVEDSSIQENKAEPSIF